MNSGFPRCLTLGIVFDPPRELGKNSAVVSARNAAVVSAACRLDTTGSGSGVLGESGDVQ